jgi:RND family efflux transporter MFP subunit
MTKLMKILLPFIIILTGIGVMAVLIAHRPVPKKEIRPDRGALVSILKVKKQDWQVIVSGTGTVEATEEVNVMPQVSGRVAYVSPSFVAGGFFQKGDLLFEIEQTDYLLALKQAEAAKAKAEHDLAVIESKARIARKEWELMAKDDRKPNPLVIYEPQLKNAKAALASASAAVEQARLNLERTKLYAPFNCRVRSEKIALGQFVTAGSSVAVLSGTDTAEIIVPLPLDELQWIDIPKPGTEGRGSSATVSISIGDTTHQWQGQVVRSTGEVDLKTRMMKIVVAVKDPYGLKNSKPALAIGSFVNVRIKGKTLSGVFVIPRNAFRDGSTVWTMDADNKLRIKKVTPLRIERDEVIISEGLNDGDLVVLTTLSGAADGMKLRPVGQEVEQ